MYYLGTSDFKLCLLTLLLLNSFQALASDSGHGMVSVGGTIVDTPCAIDTESRDQTIVMPTMTVSSVLQKNTRNKKPFYIELINCTTASAYNPGLQWGRFSITFSGDATNNNLFSVTGGTEGVGLAIRDSDGLQAIPGVPLGSETIRPGKRKLTYYLSLEANGQEVKHGHYNSVIQFAMNYY